MDDALSDTARHGATLLGVVTLHALLMAALLMSFGSTRDLKVADAATIEVRILPPVNLPKARVQSTRIHDLRGASLHVLPPAPRVTDTPSLPPPAGSSPAGSGSGVDWAAEARRALQAFEIRTHQPQTNHSISRNPTDDAGAGPHRAGDRYKTANGDWIVWINANCYQLATSGPRPFALAPEVNCPGSGSGSPKP
jgi:hypothetical protein